MAPRRAAPRGGGPGPAARRRGAPPGAVALVVGLLTAVLPGRPAGAASSGPRSTWIVELNAPPVAAYSGDVGAYAATGPRATGRPLDVDAAPARRYSAFLDGHQTQVLRAAGAGDAPVVYRYRVAFPGFAARLTAGEAARLAGSPGVRAVSRDERVEPQAAPSGAEPPDGPLQRDGAAFLGLPRGLWDRLGGSDHAGDGIVVGVLDSGIYPEHPSFADTPGSGAGRRYQGPAYDPPADWGGVCQAGEEWAAGTCNNKLIGARYFVDGFGADQIHDGEFLSPRDASGHGSHTAATAAGNYGVRPVVAGHHFGGALVSGIAPRAYLAVYKVCWTGKAGGDPSEPQGGCMASDTVAALDAAVSDGVDVINYSLGASQATAMSAVDRAFLYLADTGVFVAAAAGNSGPGPATVGSPAASPWLTAVAATTLARDFAMSVTVAPGPDAGAGPLRIEGAGLAGPLPDTPLVDALAVPAAGVAPGRAELCRPGSLDAAAVAGRVVLCKRGENARVEKGRVVAEAGGAGMVLYNATDTEGLVAEIHRVPAAHVTMADGLAIKARLPGAEVRFGGAREVAGPGDVLAPFSSRGPHPFVPDIGKVDLAAPGVQILAAATPTPAGREGGETFQLASGTSMAAPHVAGAAALLRQAHPALSSAAVRSSLVTTANPAVTTDDDRPPGSPPRGGGGPAGPFEVGAGRIDPNRAADPGLVVDAGLADYARYVKGQHPDLVADDIPPLAAVDLNLPSVTVSALAGEARTARTFTGAGAGPSAWTVTVEGLPGIEAVVDPPSFTVAAGEARSVGLAVRRVDAAFDVWVSGALLLTETDPAGPEPRTVRLPVSVRPVRVAAPGRIEITTGAAGGSAPLPVRVGFSGDVSGLGWGLARPEVRTGRMIEDGRGADPTRRGPGVHVTDVFVPAGTQLVAGEVTGADGGDPGTDLDLYLFRDSEGDGFEEDDEVARSALSGSSELIVLAVPEPGPYRFAVVGFATAVPATVYDFTTWLAGDPSPDDPSTPSTAPGLTVTGDRNGVTAGGGVTFGLEWSGVDDAGSYFGLATFYDSGAPDARLPVAATLVRLTRPQPATGG